MADRFEVEELFIQKLIAEYETARVGAVYLETTHPKYAKKEAERRAAEVALAAAIVRHGKAVIQGNTRYSADLVGGRYQLSRRPFPYNTGMSQRGLR